MSDAYVADRRRPTRPWPHAGGLPTWRRSGRAADHRQPPLLRGRAGGALPREPGRRAERRLPLRRQRHRPGPGGRRDGGRADAGAGGRAERRADRGAGGPRSCRRGGSPWPGTGTGRCRRRPAPSSTRAVELCASLDARGHGAGRRWYDRAPMTTRPTGGAEGLDCVVVGGGLAGLACAHALVRSGRTVHVLEAADAPGGGPAPSGTAGARWTAASRRCSGPTRARGSSSGRSGIPRRDLRPVSGGAVFLRGDGAIDRARDVGRGAAALRRPGPGRPAAPGAAGRGGDREIAGRAAGRGP